MYPKTESITEATKAIEALITEARADERNKCQEVVNHLVNAKMDYLKYPKRHGQLKETDNEN